MEKCVGYNKLCGNTNRKALKLYVSVLMIKEKWIWEIVIIV